jgi:hypothetical protein
MKVSCGNFVKYGLHLDLPQNKSCGIKDCAAPRATSPHDRELPIVG